MTGRGLALGVMVAIAGCGEPLVDERYRGEPIFTARGQIDAQATATSFVDGVLRASIFWQTSLEKDGRLVEQLSLSTRVEFPSTIEVQVFYPPSRAYFVESTTTAPYAVGFLLLYVDVDEDRRFQEGRDRFVGGDLRNSFLYSPQRVTADRSPTGTALSAGFSLVNLTTLCNWRRARTGQDPLPDYARCEVGRVCSAGYACRAVTKVCAPAAYSGCGPAGGSCEGGLICEAATPGCFPDAPSYADICILSSCPEGMSCEDLLRCLPDTDDTGVACGPTIGCAAGLVCDHATRICAPLLPFSIELRDRVDISHLNCGPS